MVESLKFTVDSVAFGDLLANLEERIVEAVRLGKVDLETELVEIPSESGVSAWRIVAKAARIDLSAAFQ